MAIVSGRTLLHALGAAAASLLAAGSVFAGAALAAPKDGGPTQAQIDCANRAVNDYWANMASCERVLSDLPDDLAMCQADARDDLRRARAACTAPARTTSILQIDRAPLATARRASER